MEGGPFYLFEGTVPSLYKYHSVDYPPHCLTKLEICDRILVTNLQPKI